MDVDTEALRFFDAADQKAWARHVHYLALPSPVILVKMMRACLGVTSPEQLWIYNPDEVFEDEYDSEELA